MIAFVPATPADAPLLGQLRQQCWAATYRGIYPDEMIAQFDFAWHEERDLARIRSPRFNVCLIREGSLPIGYMVLQDGAPPLLYSLYLLPSHQRRGIGHLAFERMRAWCKERGHSHFLCHCSPYNAPAMAFYRRMGGTVISEERCAESWQDTAEFRFDCT